MLEAQNTKGGISRTAPRQPKPPVHSLPPILSEMSRTPISGCSKGSRGLSVLPRVLGIFTETLISPSPSLRQRPSRYAIRAGRNLPDKEFRYLRTVHSVTSPRLGRPAHFWPALTVAREIGLSHLDRSDPIEPGVWSLRIPHKSLRRCADSVKPFLLIVRTGRIVTALVALVAPDTPDIPAYSRVCLRNYLGR